MAKQVRIYPYKMGSNSASLLAEALRERGVRCFKTYPDRNYRPKPNHVILNWGSSLRPQWLKYIAGLVINDLPAVARARNKKIAFAYLQDAGISIPECTTDREVAHGWCKTGNVAIAGVARTLLTASGGRGIVPFNHGTEYGPEGAHFPDAPLYVKYVKKSAEYRVHVFDGRVIDVQQKRKRSGVEDVNYQIRNSETGWVYCRDNINVPDAVRDQSIRAVGALGLVFGAVDVIWNQHYQTAYVLEVNTAPGLEGSTVESYANAIMEKINARGL